VELISAKASINKSPFGVYEARFTPLYSGSLNDKERDIIKSVLSEEYENGADAIRKKAFLARATLALIKEAESGKRNLKGLERIISRSLKDNSVSLLSLDGAGAFALPRVINDSFYNDETLEKINFCGLYVNKNVSSDICALDETHKNALRLSEDAENFEIFNNGILHIGLLSALFCEAGFILSFNKSITADIDAKEYKLIKLDRDIFYSDPKKYITDLFDAIDALSLKRAAGAKEVLENSRLGKITPSLTLNTASDISSLERLADARTINSVIISNLYAQTKKESVIGNVFNPMLADLRREMSRLEYKDESFLGDMLEEKYDLKSWAAAPQRFYAAGVLLKYLKTKSYQTLEFEEFKRSDFAIKADKSFEYITGLILSRKDIITQYELEEIKAANIGRWDEAKEIVKYMEFIVFRQTREDIKKIQKKGIKVIVKVNLMTLADSVDFKEGYFECGNDGETALLPQYEGIFGKFAFSERLEFLRDVMSADGFLITNIDFYRSKEGVCAHLRKIFQNGLNKKTILIFEDEEAAKYPPSENIYLLSSKGGQEQNILLKTGLDDSTSVETVVETVKDAGFKHIIVPMSFALDAPMKLDAIRAKRKEIIPAAHINTAQAFARGYEDARSGSKIAAEAKKIIVSDEEISVYKISAKGILIFSALYSYIKTNAKNGMEFQTYLSESGGLFELAKKHLSVLGENSQIMRYVERLELQSQCAPQNQRHLYNMRLLGFINAVISRKYGDENSAFKAKVLSFADSFFIKDNFLNYAPGESEIMSLYGLYLGSRDKKGFAVKLYNHLKNWDKILESENNILPLLWLIEQVSLFMDDLTQSEEIEFAKRAA
ncbi:MAG: hypothetical protein LBO62_00120, partial [Endomicrobium sp.]|nr:hypothetical protein [Endomicrobium sp.]